MKRFEQLDKALEYLSAEELLEEVIRALDDNTALDILDYITTMHDIATKDKEE